MMRWTSSLALLKSSDINVTTLCRAAAAYSRAALLFGLLVAVVQYHEHAQRNQCGGAGDSDSGRKGLQDATARQRRRLPAGSASAGSSAMSFLMASVSELLASTGLAWVGAATTSDVSVSPWGVVWRSPPPAHRRSLRSRRPASPPGRLRPRDAAGSRGLWRARRRQSPRPRRPRPLLPPPAPVHRPHSRPIGLLRRSIDAVSVDDRRAALESRHSDLLVCASALLNENGIFIFEYRRDDTACRRPAEIRPCPAEMLFPRCADAQRNVWSFITLPVAFSGSSSRNSTYRGTLKPAIRSRLHAISSSAVTVPSRLPFSTTNALPT